jgi:hypothetical protein
MTMVLPKPRTFHADLAHLPAALLPLTKLRRWVIWRWEEKRDKNGEIRWTKPPYQCAFPKAKARSNDPMTWGSYEEAVLAFTAGHCDGIGFMLKDSELGAIDLDHIRNLATREVLRWAEQLFAEAANAGCYLEWTVSGSGARIIGIARDNELHKKINIDSNTNYAVEFYRHCSRFITISAMQIGGTGSDYPALPKTTGLPEYDALFDVLYARFCDEQQRPRPKDCEFAGGPHLTVEPIEDKDELDFNNAGPQVVEFNYQDLIENGAPTGKRSEEFQRVVWHLAGLGWSAEQIAQELAKHPTGIGQKYAGRLLEEVTRSFEKWRAQRQAAAIGSVGVTGSSSAAAGAAAGAVKPWPEIRIKGGELPRVVNEAENALLGYGREIYQRGGMLVRPVLNRSRRRAPIVRPRAGS